MVAVFVPTLTLGLEHNRAHIHTEDAGSEGQAEVIDMDDPGQCLCSLQDSPYSVLSITERVSVLKPQSRSLMCTLALKLLPVLSILITPCMRYTAIVDWTLGPNLHGRPHSKTQGTFVTFDSFLCFRNNENSYNFSIYAIDKLVWSQ